MKIIIRLLAVVLYIFPSPMSIGDEKILAEVNGTKITMDDFEKEVSGLPSNYRSVIDANKRKFLDDLILQELLYQEAVKKKLEKDKDVIETIEKIKKKVLAQKLLEKEVMGLTKISEDEIKKYYEDNKDNYKIPEQLNAAHILVKADKEDKVALEKIQGLLKKIKGGGDFSALAKENSDCPSGSKGGELGYFSRGQMVPEFEDAVFKLKAGEVSDVVETKFGYHIIKLLDRKEERIKEFSELKNEIEQKLTKERQKSTFDNYAETLKAEAKITVNEDLLK